jgi:hypothetical protein
LSGRQPKFGPARVPRTPRPLPAPSPPPAATPAVIAWSEYSTRGIAPQNDPGGTGSFHFGGHINAVIALGDRDVLVGADTGGVWHLAPTIGVADNVRAFPLSDNWENPDILCLAHGPDGTGHAFAGCRTLTEKLPGRYASLPVVYEAAPTSPGVWRVVMEGSQYGSVYGIGVADGRRLVVATSTGVWWSELPAPDVPARARTFSWRAALWTGGTASAFGCTSLAIVSGRPIVSTSSGGAIWVGGWDKRGALSMTQTSTGLAGGGRSSLAVCAGHPDRLWCVVAGGDARIGGVFRTDTGGRSWSQVVGTANDGDPAVRGSLAEYGGSQGEYNNCIAVSPVEPNTVLIGWQSGILISTDGGQSYLRWSGYRDGLHPDVHTLYFDPRDRSGQTLFVGSDGGLSSSTDLGGTFSSAWNRSLANLQFASVPCRNAYGTMTMSPSTAGRVAVGLQDNGVVWGSGSGAWRTIGPGDGAAAVITSDDKVVIGSASAAGAAVLTPTATGYGASQTPLYVQADGTRVPGLPDPITEAVVHPGHAGPPVMAVGGNGPDPTTVFGLRYDKPDLSDAVWARLASLPSGVSIWSFAAADDATIFVGTSPPKVFRLDLSERGWLPTELTGMPTLIAGQPDPDGAITRIVVLSDGSVAVAYNESPYASGCTTGQVLHRDGASGVWSRINGSGTGLELLPVFGLEVDTWGVIYAATDHHVFVATGPGQPWHDMSAGLPRRVHLGHLRFVRYPSGGIALIAGTWGRSAWKATWYVPASLGRPGRQAGPGLSYNKLIGSLADGRLYEFTGKGLHPVGPIDPELQRRALASGAAFASRVGELHAQILGAAAELSDGPDDPAVGAALAAVEALHNQLARGLATLAAVSESTTSWPLRDLQRSSLQATADVVTATSGLAEAPSAYLPALIKDAMRAVTGAAATHAAIMASIERTAGPAGESG